MTTLTNIPDAHEFDREIPAGKVLLSDRPPATDRRVKRIEMDARMCWEGRTRVRLFAQTAGWACAGSTMRWDNGAYGYDYEVNGCTHGRSFKTFGEALEAFHYLPA